MAKRHWIAVVLVVSIGLNLMGAGALAVRWFTGPAPPTMMWALEGMDESIRSQVRPALREKMAVVAPIRRELRKVFADIRRVVTAESLDEAALTVALAELRDVSGRYQLEIHTAALEVLPQLSREQRIRVLRRLLHAGMERPPRQGDKPPRPPRPNDPTSGTVAPPAIPGYGSGQKERESTHEGGI